MSKTNGRISGFPLVGLLTLSALLPGQLLAHGGVDHGDDAGAAAIHRVAAPRFAVEGEQASVIGILVGGQLRLFVEQRATNEPLDDAGLRLSVELGGEETTALARADGSFEIPAAHLEPGRSHPLLITLTGSIEDLLVAELSLPMTTGDADHGEDHEGLWASLRGWFGGAATTPQPGEPEIEASWADELASRRLPDGTLFIPEPAQRQLGLRTLIPDAHQGWQSSTLQAQVIADPDHSAQVLASTRGVLERVGDGFPGPGARVEAGQRLAQIRPLLSPIEETQRYVDIAETERDIYVAEVKLQRLDPRGEIDLDTPTDNALVDATRMDLRTAKRNKTALEAVFTARIPVTAPVGGLVANPGLRQGQVVEVGTPLLEIIDPGKLLVEATSYDDAAPANPARAQLQLADGSLLELAYLGADPVLDGLGRKLRLRIIDPPADLAIGQVAQVRLQGEQRLSGWRLPRGSLALDVAGRQVVWVQADAERFSQVAIDATPLNDREVLVTGDLQPGDRVLTPESVPLINGVR